MFVASKSKDTIICTPQVNYIRICSTPPNGTRSRFPFTYLQEGHKMYPIRRWNTFVLCTFNWYSYGLCHKLNILCTIESYKGNSRKSKNVNKLCLYPPQFHSTISFHPNNSAHLLWCHIFLLSKAFSCYAGHFYFSYWTKDKPHKANPRYNVIILTICKTIWNVVASSENLEPTVICNKT